MITYAYVTGQPGSQESHDQYIRIVTFASENALRGPIEFRFESVDHDGGSDPELTALIAGMQRGDVLVVTGWSALGGTLAAILNLLSTLAQCGVRVFVTDRGFRLADVTEAQVVGAACALVTQIESEFETQRIAPKTVQGSSDDRPATQPHSRTRKSRLDGHEEEISFLLQGGATLAQIARAVETNRQTVADFIASRDLASR